jgi:hypothetical protein
MAVAAVDGSVEARFGAFVRENLPLRPSEYWERQCYLAASSMSRQDWEAVDVAGVDHVMWGADYPHTEGTHPYTAESLRHTFAGMPRERVRLLLGGNAARLYGFDLERLTELAAEIGPRVDQVDQPLADDDIPENALTMALRGTPS